MTTHRSEGQFSETLRKKRQSPAAVLQSYRLKAHQRDVHHLFVEGYDDKLYYSTHIIPALRAIGKRCEVYVCFGKKNSKKVFELHAVYNLPAERLTFIIDSDFDSILGRGPKSPLIIYTWGYSVENYVFEPASYIQSVVALLGLELTELAEMPLQDNYDNLIQNVFKQLVPFFSLCLSAIRMREAKLDLDIVPIGQTVKSALSGSIDTSWVRDMEILSKIGFIEQDFRESKNEFYSVLISQPAAQWLRGKYLLECGWQMFGLIKETMRLAVKAGDISCYNRRASIGIAAESLLVALAPHAQPPHDILDHVLKTAQLP